MKKIITILIIAMMIATLSACGDATRGTYIGKDPIETRTYSLSDFKSFAISNDFDGTITKGDEYSVKVSTNADVFDKIYVDTEGNTFVARNAEGIILEQTKITIEIICPEAVAFTLRNDADIVLNGEFKTAEDVSILIENDASLMGELTGDNLNVKVFNDGILNLSGSFKNAVIKGENDSSVDLSDVKLNSVIVNVQNDTKVDVLSQSDVEITGSNSAVVNVYSGNVIRKSVDEDVTINIID